MDALSRIADYQRRIVDDEIDELSPSLPAIALDGPKGVGKTTTALERAATVMALDDPVARDVLAADPNRVANLPPPVLIDEWQQYPPVWDVVRRVVDRAPSPGQFLLTGSASPDSPPTHSGAGRIVPVRMRPLTLPERGGSPPTVSLKDLLSGERAAVEGSTSAALEFYVEEILASGFPLIRRANGRARRSLLDDYIQLVIDRDFGEAGHEVRNPAALRRWMAAYAAATATTTSFETIRDAATSGVGEKPARSTVVPYRDTLERIWILDPVPSWGPGGSHLRRLTGSPKHNLADPALAARLVGASAGTLLSGADVVPSIPRDGPFLGSLFESLVALSLRVFAQANEASLFHLRTMGGEREVDFIVERDDGRVVAIEAKLSRTFEARHARHLHWLANMLGDRLLDAVVITTGPEAYRRSDGIAVVPAALLGP